LASIPFVLSSVSGPMQVDSEPELPPPEGGSDANSSSSDERPIKRRRRRKAGVPQNRLTCCLQILPAMLNPNFGFFLLCLVLANSLQLFGNFAAWVLIGRTSDRNSAFLGHFWPISSSCPFILIKFCTILPKESSPQKIMRKHDPKMSRSKAQLFAICCCAQRQMRLLILKGVDMVQISMATYQHSCAFAINALFRPLLPHSLHPQ